VAGMIGAWAKVVLGTDSAVLDSVAVEQAVVIQMGAGVFPIAGAQARRTGHHREAVLVFSASPESCSAPEPRER
jgi:hypothetical protein